MKIVCLLGSIDISDKVSSIALTSSTESDKTESVTIELVPYPDLSKQKVGVLVKLEALPYLKSIQLPLSSLTIKHDGSSIVCKGPRHQLNNGTQKRRTYKTLTLANLASKIARDHSVKITYPSSLKTIEIEHLDQRDITDYALLTRELDAHGYTLHSLLNSPQELIITKTNYQQKPSLTLSLLDASTWSYATKDKQDDTDKTKTTGLSSATANQYTATTKDGDHTSIDRPLSATSSPVDRHNKQINKASSDAVSLNLSYPLIAPYFSIEAGSKISLSELPQNWTVTNVSIHVGGDSKVDLTLTAPTLTPLTFPKSAQTPPPNVPQHPLPTESAQVPTPSTYDPATGQTRFEVPVPITLDEPSKVVLSNPQKITVTTLGENPKTVTALNPNSVTDLTELGPKTTICVSSIVSLLNSEGNYAQFNPVP